MPTKKKKGKQGPLGDPNKRHHYIPQFILRTFAIDNYDRKFVMSPNYQLQALPYKNNKNQLCLQTYNRMDNQLGISLIKDTYEYEYMYIDLNNENAMHVEKELSVLEGKASKVIRDIIEKSQSESQIVLFRKDLSELRKFLFIMDYRKPHRCSQFNREKFDHPTWLRVQEFIRSCNLQNAREVWLQNITQILKTPHKEVKDNPLIFEIDRDNYKQRMVDSFLVIWQAGENDEFLMTNNGFGTFEGVSGEIAEGLPFQFPYHLFYIISPKLVLVLCHISFRKGLEFDKHILYNEMGFRRSIFENAPHPHATPNYVSKINASHCSDTLYSDMPYDLAMKSIGLRRHDDDTFTFPFAKITSATVHLVNSIILNETNEQDLVVSFNSPSYLYKTIVKYHAKQHIGFTQNFSNLKKKLFTTLNRTHEDLCLRKNIQVNRS
ncbi:1001_t:CDS:1 [Dentiscutata heterogama]|uniref:1001_t:CDS:1 n=1 Tax=Dentiscutata heterogama TaxID=1316150 RepID=A0ACA9JXA9_9GLOM|nr:1001_t:CDS:1 [Dentiscutata heterogama]